MEKALLQAINISRSFGEYQAVRPTDFEIYAGQIIVLVGSNGAGKTTLLHCLAGLLRPTSGNILVDGFDLYRDEVSAKERLAYVPDVPRFYQELTVWEHLYFISMAYKAENAWEARAEKFLREYDLWNNRDYYPHNLSRGMRLKLGLILALIRPFSVLLLDEPTSALDEGSINLVQAKLVQLRESGCAIMLTSHDANLAEFLNGTRWRMEQGQLETG